MLRTERCAGFDGPELALAHEAVENWEDVPVSERPVHLHFILYTRMSLNYRSGSLFKLLMFASLSRFLPH